MLASKANMIAKEAGRAKYTDNSIIDILIEINYVANKKHFSLIYRKIIAPEQIKKLEKRGYYVEKVREFCYLISWANAE